MADFDENKIDPCSTFFISVFEGNIDGTLNLSCESPAGHGSIPDAVEQAVEDVGSWGGAAYVYKVVPVRRVRRLGNGTRVEIATLDG